MKTWANAAEWTIQLRSETTASALTSLVYELCKHRKIQRKLQAEIDHFDSRNRGGDDEKENDEDDQGHVGSEYEGLHELKYLQACINEVLRLHVRKISSSLLTLKGEALVHTWSYQLTTRKIQQPPVPRGLQRMTPPEGLQLGKHFIPGDTIVQNPTHTMFHGKASTGSRQCSTFTPFAPTKSDPHQTINNLVVLSEQDILEVTQYCSR